MYSTNIFFFLLVTELDEKSFAGSAGNVRPTHKEESAESAFDCPPPPLFLGLLQIVRVDKNMSAGPHGLYVLRFDGGGKGIISHLSCLQDEAVCLTSNINNVTGPNLPGL